MTIDAAATIPSDQARRDAKCIRCGYDLRGHDFGGRCPECGLKAHWSLKAPVLLSQYPAGWVATMARGVKLLSLAYLVLFVMLILAVGGATEGRDVLLYAILFLAGTAQAAGAWMLARSSRHWSEPRSPVNRALLLITPLALPLAAAGAMWLKFDYRQAVAGVTFLLGILSVVTPIAAFARLRTVARMISDADLMEHSTIVGGGFLISAAALVGLYLVAVLVGTDGDGARSTWLVGATFVVLITWLLFLLWGAFLMFCCILDFSQAARIAMADWRNDDEPPPPTAAGGSA